MKSDPSSDKTPSVGTIKPQADIDKVLGYIKETFSTWLETRGIRVGNTGTTDGSSFSSGISKIIDEMDTIETIKRQMDRFRFDEYNFWQLIKNMHNAWIEQGELRGVRQLPEEWEVITQFKEPGAQFGKAELVDLVAKQLDAGILSRETGIKMVNPTWGEDEIQEELERIDNEETASLPQLPPPPQFLEDENEEEQIEG